MNIGIVNDLPLAVEALRRVIALRATTACCGSRPTATRRWISASRIRPMSC